jgi:glucose/mannose transport system permease protein
MTDIPVHDPEEQTARVRYLASRIAVYGLLTIFASVYMLPLFVVIFNSFRDLPEIAQNGLIAFPRSFTFKSWYDAWNTYCINGTCEGMHGNFFNSLKMTIPATILLTATFCRSGASRDQNSCSPVCCSVCSCQAKSL